MFDPDDAIPLTKVVPPDVKRPTSALARWKQAEMEREMAGSDVKEDESALKLLSVARLNLTKQKATCPRCLRKFRQVRFFRLCIRKECDELGYQVFSCCKKCFNEIKPDFESGKFLKKLQHQIKKQENQ